jgi:hypothetical protein
VNSSELHRAIPGVSQKMLIQQLRNLEGNGIVTRKVHPEVPPKLEYSLSEAGLALRPALVNFKLGPPRGRTDVQGMRIAEAPRRMKVRKRTARKPNHRYRTSTTRVYQKPKPGRSDGEVHQVSRVN